jgi:UMF1 family MFS transporter
MSPAFGLDPALREGDRISGPLTALWFVVFVAPLFLFTPDLPKTGVSLRQAAGRGFGQLRETLREVRRWPSMARFLIANMVYQDGLVALFAFGAILFETSVGSQNLRLLGFREEARVTACVGCVQQQTCARSEGNYFPTQLGLSVLRRTLSNVALSSSTKSP